MDNKSTTKRMIGAVVLVLIAALLLAWLLKGKSRSLEESERIAEQTQGTTPIIGFPELSDNQNVSEQALQSPVDSQEYIIGSETEAAQTSQPIQQAEQASSSTQEGTSPNFQVRANQEVRPVVEQGEMRPGVGSMGGGEMNTADQVPLEIPKTPVSSTSTAAAESEQGTTIVGREDATSTETAPVATTDAASATTTAASTSPSLVNERPVPAPPSTPAARPAPSPATSTSTAGTTTMPAAPPAPIASPAATSASAAVSADAASASGYVIQVLATASRAGAEKVRQSIAADGYPTFITQATVNGKMVYRVRVGAYPARSDANAIQRRMKARYTRNQYVQNSFVTRN